MNKIAKTFLLTGGFLLLFCTSATALVVLPIDHDWTVSVLGYKFGIESYPAYGSTPACSVVFYGAGNFDVWQSPYIVAAVIVAVPLLVIVVLLGLLSWRRRRRKEIT
jgi:hypothetical protein